MYEKVQLKKSIDGKLNDLYSQREVLESRVDFLKDKMHHEQADVDKLERGSLSAYFYELTGQIDKKLDKEKQEAYEAKAKYNAAKYQLDIVYQDIQYYENQLDSLRNCESEYQEAYHQQINLLKETNEEVIKLDEQLIASQQLQKELDEAIQAGNIAMKLARKVQSELNSADGWATWDVFGGGLLSDVMKYSSLDEAEKLIQQLQTQLGRFQTELADVKINAQIQLSIGEFLRFADYFFDNIFTDFAVADKISKARHEIKQTMNEIDEVINTLNHLLKEEKNKEDNIKYELEKIVIE